MHFHFAYRYHWIPVLLLTLTACLISKSGSAQTNLDPTAYEDIARVAFELELPPAQAQHLMKYYDWAFIKKITPAEILEQGLIDSRILKNYLKNPLAFERLPVEIHKKLVGKARSPSRIFIQTQWDSIPKNERASLVDLDLLSPKDQAELIASLPLHRANPPIQIDEILKLKPSAPQELKNLSVEFDGQAGSLYLEYKTPDNIRGIKRPFESLDWLMNEIKTKNDHRAGNWQVKGGSLHYHFSFPGIPQMEARLGARLRRFNILRSLEIIQANMSSKNYIENIRNRGTVRFLENDHGEIRTGTLDVHTQVVEDFRLLTLPDELFNKEISQKIIKKLNFYSIDDILIFSPSMITRDLLEDIKNSTIQNYIREWAQKYALQVKSAASIHLQLDPKNIVSAQIVRMHLQNLSAQLKTMPKGDRRKLELNQIELIRALGQSETQVDRNIALLKQYIDTSRDRPNLPEKLPRYAQIALDSFEPLSEKQLSTLIEDSYLYFQEDWSLLRDLSRHILKRKPIPPTVSESLGSTMSLYMDQTIQKDPRFSGVAMTFFPDLVDAMSETPDSLGQEAIHGLKQLTLQAEPAWVAARAGLALMKKGITPTDVNSLDDYLKKLEDPETPESLRNESLKTIQELSKTQPEFQAIFGEIETQKKLNTLLTRAQENTRRYRLYNSILPYWEAEKQTIPEGLRCLRDFTWIQMIQTIGR